MKTFELKYEPVVIQDIEIPKWNVYYYVNGKLELKENYSCNGIVSSEIREGYKLNQ